MTESGNQIVPAPLFPTYKRLKHCVRIWDGLPVKAVREMISDIYDQTGTPQKPVDWRDPDNWIAERLNGQSAQIAKKLWRDSNKEVNPRHTYGCYLLNNHLKLLEQVTGTYSLGERGERFLSDDEEILEEIDAREGIPKLLALIAVSESSKSSDLIDAWSDYLLTASKFRAPSIIKDALRRRIKNLLERGLIIRERNRYSINSAGMEYLSRFPKELSGEYVSSERTNVSDSIKTFNKSQLEELKERLMTLKPYEFEHFVKALLEAMDYENVEVTKQSGDKGVDVVANYQFGITEITEVVQVKRSEGTISRRIVDELRGALPYHDAIRGTIITLGRFAKGVEEYALYRGAAPITLIDGDRLLELIQKHKVGIAHKPVYLVEIDEEFFTVLCANIDEIE